VLLVAKKKHFVDSLHDLLVDLEREAGFYLSDNVRRLALQEAGESE
jgi:hypothetical protein